MSLCALNKQRWTRPTPSDDLVANRGLMRFKKLVVYPTWALDEVILPDESALQAAENNCDEWLRCAEEIIGVFSCEDIASGTTLMEFVYPPTGIIPSEVDSIDIVINSADLKTLLCDSNDVVTRQRKKGEKNAKFGRQRHISEFIAFPNTGSVDNLLDESLRETKWFDVSKTGLIYLNGSGADEDENLHNVVIEIEKIGVCKFKILLKSSCDFLAGEQLLLPY